MPATLAEHPHRAAGDSGNVDPRMAVEPAVLGRDQSGGILCGYGLIEIGRVMTDRKCMYPLLRVGDGRGDHPLNADERGHQWHDDTDRQEHSTCPGRKCASR